MPFSFTEIEKSKSRVIAAAFAFLVVLYFAAVYIIAVLIRNYQSLAFFYADETIASSPLSPGESFFVLAIAVLLAAGHWLVTIHSLKDRVLGILKAQPPVPENTEERMFQNIVEELRVATGGAPMEAMVIPSLALNACAVSDGHSTPVIAVTKGILYKLNRSQIEAVVAHEAGHILRGDGAEAMIISSMFEIFGATLRAIRTGVESAMESSNDPWEMFPGRGSGRMLRLGRFPHVIIFILLIVLVIWIVHALSLLMRMFISREREYRADAVAARLTRNPLALAEALYIIAHKRHTLLDAADSLETIFIVNPQFSALDQGEGVFPDLFSTHPPVESRLDILLNMAHGMAGDLKTALQTLEGREEQERREREVLLPRDPQGLWLLQRPGEQGWSGPFKREEMARMEWLTPETLIRPQGLAEAFPLTQMAFYENKTTGQKTQPDVSKTCPACGEGLEFVMYERVRILTCRKCGGVLVGEDDIPVILHRKEHTFDERIQGMARTIRQEHPPGQTVSLPVLPSDRKSYCERCQPRGRNMRKCLFNRYYHVEIDKCMDCGRVWFDKDELDVMQCLYETWETEGKRPMM